MNEAKKPADEVLLHSEEDGEWEDEAEEIETRPSGTQVISARLPGLLAEHVLSEASQRGIRPSELVRQALEAYMRSGSGTIASVSVQTTGSLSVSGKIKAQPTQNPNLVVDQETEPLQVAC